MCSDSTHTVLNTASATSFVVKFDTVFSAMAWDTSLNRAEIRNTLLSEAVAPSSSARSPSISKISITESR
ncbi:hypothetical protein D3C78_1805540 [compost metagenome]